MNQKISVVLPVYNEAADAERILSSVYSFSEENPGYNFIFVDDGSTDLTRRILEKKINETKSKKISLVSYPINQGKGYAIKKGVEYADGNYIFFTDGDLAYSLDQLDALYKKLKECDMVMGCRPLIKENTKNLKFYRKILGRTFNYFAKLILKIEFTDTQAGIKGFKKEAAKNLFRRQKIRGFSFDTEIIHIAKKLKYKIGEVPVVVSENHLKKNSKVNPILDSIKMFFGLLKIQINSIRGKYE